MNTYTRACCNNYDCQCPQTQCTCSICGCGKPNCPGCVNNQQYTYNKCSHYSNIEGKQQSSQKVTHRINDLQEEEILKEQKLDNGCILVTKETLEDGKVKSIDQYIISPKKKKYVEESADPTMML